MRKLIFALMSVVFLASFTACSTDDDGIVGNNNNIENPGDNNGDEDNNGGANFDEFLYNLIQQDGKGRWVTDTSHSGMIFNIDTEPHTIDFNIGVLPGYHDQRLTFEAVSNNEIKITGIIFQGSHGEENYFEVGDIVKVIITHYDNEAPKMMLYNQRVDGVYTGNHHRLYWKAHSN